MYTYLQYHDCSEEANYGFAFNEGWAKFWAGQCIKDDLCYWKPTLSLIQKLRYQWRFDPCNYKYKIEGNVANGLRALQTYCNTSDADMVAVLRDSGENSIHSFAKFNNNHYLFYDCELGQY